MKGEKPGLVVKAEDSRSRGRGFESRCRKLDRKLLQCNEKMEKNKGSQMRLTAKKNDLTFFNN